MRSHLTRLPKIRIQRRYIRTAAQAAGETVALLVFGFALGIAVITAAYSTPAGAGRNAVWVIGILGCVAAILFANRGVEAVHGRRAKRRRCDPSTGSGPHNPSGNATNRRFRRG